ncbi:MAG: UvrD-helicase domain-containing protein [Bacteroidetes bacterium]|nr:UvrD-helicase domain-containing protein [Bacteroidota bacterium]
MSFSVYKSSAGSGKTYTLVKEYLGLVLLNPYQFKAILAITFTNKAAAEMKQRILQTLKLLADFTELSPDKKLSTQHLLNDLIEKTGLKEADIQKNASLTLTLILHHYSNFAVGTIDSFVHRIVRTFAHDLRLPLNFNVEMDGETLISQAVDLLIDRMGNDELLTTFLFDFARSKADNDKSWHIENELKKYAGILLDEDSQLKIEKLKGFILTDFKKILDQLLQLIKSFENRAKATGTEVWQKIKENNISHEVFFQGKNGFGRYFEKLSQGIIARPNSYVGKAIDENKWTSGKATNDDKARIDSIKSSLITGYQNIMHLLETEYESYIIRNAILKNLYSLGLLNEIEKIMDEMRDNENIIHISEFNKRIADIVVNEPIPFIYERLGERFKHFLLDEFQDTSILQWQNLLPLLDNSLAENNFNMVVGDGKQAIYRFRGGEVEQFAHLPEVYKKTDNEIINEREATLIRNYEPRLLKKNFRSKAEIVDFNNQFFSFVSSKLNDNLKIIYDKLEQEFNAENNGGYIQFDFFETTDKEQYEKSTFGSILNTINDLLAADYQWSDITILCRNNRQANKVACFLTDNHIDVISSESLLLNSSPQVRLMIALLKLLSNANDLISKAQVVQYLITSGIIEEDAFQNILKNSIQQDTSLNKKFENLLQQYQIEFNTLQLLKLPLYELCETLIRIFSLNKSSNPYIQFFLDCMLNFTIKKTANIPDFLMWWEEQKAKLSLKTPAGSNAVSIMTVHKSKGLEFKVVIFPFAEEKQRNTKDVLWINVEDDDFHSLPTALIGMNKELEGTKYAEQLNEEKGKSKLDLINLLYVALTRPSERLYITTSLPKANSDILSLPQLFMEYLQHIQIWEEGKTSYSIGNTEQHKAITDTVADHMLMMKDFYSIDWQQRIRVSRLAPDNWLSDDPDGSRRFGNFIHLILSKLKNADEIEKECITLYTKGLINQKEKENLSKLLHKLWQVDAIKQLFENAFPAKNEAEILLSNGKTIRPDRLLFRENECIIIDYKTGKAEESHRKQLANYQAAMEDMGYKNVKKCLIYVNELPEMVMW